MATKAGPENKDEIPPDEATKEFNAEKIRMRTAKATMTRAVRRLETAINDYNEFKDLEVDNKDFVAVSREVSESLEESKAAYKKMESINTRLEEKVVELNELEKVPDVNKTLAELGEALEQYWMKYEAVRRLRSQLHEVVSALKIRSINILKFKLHQSN